MRNILEAFCYAFISSLIFAQGYWAVTGEHMGEAKFFTQLVITTIVLAFLFKKDKQ